MARREVLTRENPTNTGDDATRRKIDQIVRSVMDAGHERDFEALAAREVRHLQQAPTRGLPLTLA